MAEQSEIGLTHVNLARMKGELDSYGYFEVAAHTQPLPEKSYYVTSSDAQQFGGGKMYNLTYWLPD
jgi:hypothetical protein